MATPVLMPRQGNTVEECLLATWRKKKGDAVHKGEPIADIETDKATFELESPVDGVLLETFVDEGNLAPVMTNIAVIGAVGESTEEFKPTAITPLPTSVPTVKVEEQESTAMVAKPATVNSSAPPHTERAAAPLSPRAKAFSSLHNIATIPTSGSGPDGRVLEKDIKELVLKTNRISPAAMELIKKGYRKNIEGSGANGLIRMRDLAKPGKPLNSIRTIIATRMKESLTGTAQYTVSMKAPASKLLSLRAKIKPLASCGKLPDISINDLVNFAVIKTLPSFPEINSELIDGVLYTYNNINLSFACDTKKGLLVPVIKNAEKMAIGELAKETRRLVAAANEGRILPEELSGGTFTVSNLGSFGVTDFTPIINTPQTAILGVCAISLEPIRSSDNKIVFEEKIGFSLTSDHQVVDGALAAKFLKSLGETVASIDSKINLAI